MSVEHYDIAVIGAGPAGSAAAYFLARGGLRVVLLDKFNFPRDKTCGDGLTPRALNMLASMDALSQVEEFAYHCSALTLRNSDELTYRIELSILKDLPQRILILPRFRLDDILLRQAIAAGAQFFPQAKVENINPQASNVQIQIEGNRSLDCTLAVIATGANTGLLGKTGLLKHNPPVNLAARAYFENVDDLDNAILLFFDEVEQPGYGWVFPTSNHSANIGCGVFFDSPTPQPTHLKHLLESHPYLKRILRNARQVGPIKGYPLRTDFSRFLSGKGQILVTGEALGLVNPITGEGIDCALESAKLAAEAILMNWRADAVPGRIQKKYRRALGRTFGTPFTLLHLAQRFFFRESLVDKGLRRIQESPHLQQVAIDSCFGLRIPISMFSPRTLWEIFRP